ncbi:unnamed protein product, partial [Meganyctiphanes norvegica]
ARALAKELALNRDTEDRYSTEDYGLITLFADSSIVFAGNLVKMGENDQGAINARSSSSQWLNHLENFIESYETLTENVLGLKSRRFGRSRRIVSAKIPLGINGKRIKERDRTLIHNSTARKSERLFNVLPQSVRNITETTTENFKRHLDKWLSSIPDTPKIDGYGANVAAETNSIFHQTRYCIVR